MARQYNPAASWRWHHGWHPLTRPHDMVLWQAVLLASPAGHHGGGPDLARAPVPAMVPANWRAMWRDAAHPMAHPYPPLQLPVCTGSGADSMPINDGEWPPALRMATCRLSTRSSLTLLHGCKTGSCCPQVARGCGSGARAALALKTTDGAAAGGEDAEEEEEEEGRNSDTSSDNGVSGGGLKRSGEGRQPPGAPPVPPPACAPPEPTDPRPNHIHTHTHPLPTTHTHSHCRHPHSRPASPLALGARFKLSRTLGDQPVDRPAVLRGCSAAGAEGSGVRV